MSGSGAEDASLAAGGLMYEDLDTTTVSLLAPDKTASSESRNHPCGGADSNAANPPAAASCEEATGEARRINSTCDCRGEGMTTASAGTAVANLSGGGSAATTKPERDGVEVCTVGDLYPWRNFYGVTGRGEQLRLGFLRQQVIGDRTRSSLCAQWRLFSFFFACR